jgi:hypothetical protein
VRIGWRRLGALYLDVLLLSIPPELVLRGRAGAYRWLIALALALLMEALLWSRVRRSFGHYAMGLVRDGAGEWRPDPTVVPPTHGILLLFGIAHFYGAVKFFTDGVLDYDAYHLGGQRITGPAAKLVPVALALGFASSAIALFRRPAHGPLVALGVPALALLNDFTSSRLLPSTMAAAMARAQARHGGRTLPLDAETWAGLFLQVQVVHVLALLGALLVLRRQFPAGKARPA